MKNEGLIWAVGLLCFIVGVSLGIYFGKVEIRNEAVANGRGEWVVIKSGSYSQTIFTWKE